MKKLVLISLAVFISATSFGQSNKPGTIQLGLGWGLAIGGATVKSTPDGGSETSTDGTGGKINYGIRAQYGLSENLSAGIYAGAEAATYLVSNTDYNSPSYGTYDITYTGTRFGLDAKYYIINHDKFNLSPNVSVGYNTASTTYDAGGFYTVTTDVSGINYSIAGGINWYFAAETFGISADLGYMGASLSGTHDADSYTPKSKVTISNGNIFFGFGLTVKFGGK